MRFSFLPAVPMFLALFPEPGLLHTRKHNFLIVTSFQLSDSISQIEVVFNTLLYLLPILLPAPFMFFQSNVNLQVLLIYFVLFSDFPVPILFV